MRGAARKGEGCIRTLAVCAACAALTVLSLPTLDAGAHHPAEQLREQQLRAARMERLSRQARRWPRVRHWRAERVRIKRLRARLLREHRLRARLTPPGPAVLERIAWCESRGNPRAVSPGGRYRGKYQFDHATWRSVGGRGDPAAAPELEQDYRAALLYRRRGPAPWPICGYR